MIIPKYEGFSQERKIGEYTIILPDPPNINKIANRGLPAEKQKFRPEWYSDKEMLSWDESKRAAFEEREWDRRRNGFWFFNNGKLEYLTGTHYLYCAWWKIDVGLPYFVDSDRDFFYLWRYVEMNPRARGLVFVDRRRGGKALCINTDIPTVDGWKKMGDIKVGDMVFGSDGKPTCVKYVSPIAFNRKCYRVNFSDGSHVIADEEHLWIVNDKMDRKKMASCDVGYQIKTTKDLLLNLKTGQKKESNWSIVNCSPVRYSKKELPIPPYIMGTRLGSDTLTDSSIANIDNKHIPRCYLESNIEDRVSLLQGLMDTYGYAKGYTSSLEFCTKHKSFADDFLELISSLGCNGRVSSKLNKKHNRYYYYVRFTADNIKAFRLQRKLDRTPKSKSAGWNVNLRYITSITEVDTVPVLCIEVSNEDSSFLCTKNFIKTHNTWKSTCVMYDGISQTPNVIGSVQSKSNEDAKKLFDKLVFSWKRLPYFFKPVDIGESNPKSKLEFSEPGKRDTKNLDKKYNLVLDSLIDYTNAKAVALDGTKQFRCIQDEIGKVDPGECDVDERINVVKECVMAGTKIVGKILATTTVESVDKGGGNFRKVIEKTNPENLMPNGETENGLLRYLNPAYYGLEGEDENGVPFINEFGYSDTQRAKEYLDKRLASIKKWEDKNSERRKYAQTWRDCFVVEGKNAVYDLAKIEQQIEHNKTLKSSILTRGNFHWKDGVQWGEVEFSHNENGRWLVAWMPPPELRNKSTIKFGKKSPSNTDIGCFGLDPYDNKTTVDNRKSDAASYGFRKFDPMAPYDSGIFVCEYVNRPKLPEAMWEDMIMQCVFYGWEILVESNKIGTINFFRMKGYENYLMKRPEETQTEASRKMEEPGIPMTGEEARMALIHATESYIVNKVGLIEEEGKEPYMGKCYFDKLLDQWSKFDFDKKWTEFDCMVGAGLALLGSRKYIPKQISKRINGAELFKTYSNSGGDNWVHFGQIKI